MTIARVFSFPIFMCLSESLNLITQLYNGGLSSGQKEELIVGVATQTGNGKEFTSQTMCELPGRKSPALRKGCHREDLLRDKQCRFSEYSLKLKNLCMQKIQLDFMLTLLQSIFLQSLLVLKLLRLKTLHLTAHSCSSSCDL